MGLRPHELLSKASTAHTGLQHEASRTWKAFSTPQAGPSGQPRLSPGCCGECPGAVPAPMEQAFCAMDAGTLTVAGPWLMLPGRVGEQASSGSPSHSRASAGRGAFNMKPVALAVSRPCKPQRRTGYSRQERHSSAEPVMAASSSWRGSMPANGSDRPSVDKPAPDARRGISAIGEAPRLQRGLQRAAPRGSGTIEAGDCSTQLLLAVPWQRAASRDSGWQCRWPSHPSAGVAESRQRRPSEP